MHTSVSFGMSIDMKTWIFLDFYVDLKKHKIQKIP